jgi:putative membrane protein
VSLAPQLEWRRLSARMLLIHPVREVGRFIPAIAGLLIAGRTTGFGPWWGLVGVVLVIALSIARWYTTRYRITPTQVELRTGLLNRRTVVAPADRVRTVDVTAPVLHRLLGLAKVDIGTGGGGRGESLVLDALSSGPAGQLRAELLHRRTATAPAGAPSAAPAASGSAGAATDGPAADGPPGDSPAAGVPAAGGRSADGPAADRPGTTALSVDAVAGPGADLPETELLRLDPRWIGYAPFTLSGAVTALAVVGVAWRLVDQLDIDAARLPAVRGVVGHLESTPLWVDVLQGLAGLAAVITLLAVGGYVISFWGYRLTRHHAGTLHVSRGLLTTRATSIEERRLRGVEVGEPVALRLLGGRRLSAITTGLRARNDNGGGSAMLVPPAARAQVSRVVGEVLRDPTVMDVPLRPHGSAARRRRLLRALLPALAVLVAAGVLWRLDVLPGWVVPVAAVPLLLAVPLGLDRYRGLGHAVSGDYLITRSGSLARHRDVVARDGVIGWNVEQTLFQRRAGLVTLRATTAAGSQSYALLDVTPQEAVRVVQETTPDLLRPFLADAR